MKYVLERMDCANLSNMPSVTVEGVFDSLEDAKSAAYETAKGKFEASVNFRREFASSLHRHFGLSEDVIPSDGRVSITTLLVSSLMSGRQTIDELEDALGEWWDSEISILGYPCWVIKADDEWRGHLGPCWRLDDDYVNPGHEEDFFDTVHDG